MDLPCSLHDLLGEVGKANLDLTDQFSLTPGASHGSAVCSLGVYPEPLQKEVGHDLALAADYPKYHDSCRKLALHDLGRIIGTEPTTCCSESSGSGRACRNNIYSSDSFSMKSIYLVIIFFQQVYHISDEYCVFSGNLTLFNNLFL